MSIEGKVLTELYSKKDDENSIEEVQIQVKNSHFTEDEEEEVLFPPEITSLNDAYKTSIFD